MLRDRVAVRFGGSQEKQAYDREREARPELMRWLLANAQNADRIVAHRIRRGVFGKSVAKIDAAVEVLCQDGLNALRRGPVDEQPDESQKHFWRLGFVGAAYEARDIALGLGAPAANC
ncbi:MULTISPECIES: hypothetical protein [unclassified Methylobacterium]|uniref:hypothetical protein n=1 Tax=unclassified Methylobacterium TaxID=2615210 RepID=UPI0011C20B4C|nr:MULTISPECIES: hypothetical protein [unclassified Methylobacterium]QEE40705.1 hypothetical protein FVA80_18620 [Methylobacterium sp. WL1]TXN55843.1 hypothetical protein FV241_18030 [Methylobacterium sp. WL2]